MLTLNAQTLLLHAKQHWPEAITTMIWSYALRFSEEVHNNLKLNKNDWLPLSSIVGILCTIQPNKFLTQGFLVYVWNAWLQSGGDGPPKWELCSCFDICLAYLSVHAGSGVMHCPQIPPISHHFYNTFHLVGPMRTRTVCSNWADLVQFSLELSTLEWLDLHQTWFSSACSNLPKEGD